MADGDEVFENEACGMRPNPTRTSYDKECYMEPYSQDISRVDLLKLIEKNSELRFGSESTGDLDLSEDERAWEQRVSERERLRSNTLNLLSQYVNRELSSDEFESAINQHLIAVKENDRLSEDDKFELRRHISEALKGAMAIDKQHIESRLGFDVFSDGLTDHESPHFRPK